jgi:hypothetical protein
MRACQANAGQAAKCSLPGMGKVTHSVGQHVVLCTQHNQTCHKCGRAHVAPAQPLTSSTCWAHQGYTPGLPLNEQDKNA